MRSDHGLRLHSRVSWVGLVVDSLVSSTRSEATTMTPHEIIAHRRRRVIELAGELGNVAAACRQMGVSRTSYYRWVGRAARYGTGALTPKPRRRPVVPGAFAPHIVEAILAEALARATLGAQQLVGYLAERGVLASHSGVQKILRRHNLHTRSLRVRAMAQITAAEAGVLTREALEGPFGFCHFAAPSGGSRRSRQLLHRSAQRHRHGVAVDRDRHPQPLGGGASSRRPPRPGQGNPVRP